MVIFQSYLSLPEGKLPFSYSFPMVFQLKPVFHGPPSPKVTTAILLGDPSLCASDATSALRTARYMDDALETFYGGRADAFWKQVESWGVNSKWDWLGGRAARFIYVS